MTLINLKIKYMNIKKSLINILAIWSIFFVFSVSFWWIISLWHKNLDKFWVVKDINISNKNSVYAEDRDIVSTSNSSIKTKNLGNSTINQANSSKTCKIVYDTVSTASWKKVQQQREVCDSVSNTSNNISDTVLNDSNKMFLDSKINVLNSAIDTKISKITTKLVVYKDFSELLKKKISLFESFKKLATSQNVNDKFDKKISFYDKLKKIVDKKVQIYTVIINQNNKKNVASGQSKIATQKVIDEKTKRDAQKAKIEQARIDAQKSKDEQAKIDAKNEAARQAKIAAAEQARIAAQNTAQNNVNTTTRAS